MAFTTYILFSKRLDQHYAGHTQDLAVRLGRHNAGGSPHTSRGAPWAVVYHENFSTRAEAMRYENRIKKTGAAKFLATFVQKSLKPGKADASP